VLNKQEMAAFHHCRCALPEHFGAWKLDWRLEKQGSHQIEPAFGKRLSKVMTLEPSPIRQTGILGS
jgi:hypothetical protein